MDELQNKTVVTLTCEEFKSDYELPTAIPLSELSNRLLCVLQQEEPKLFNRFSKLWLASDKGVFADQSATLNDYGVCSGTVIKVICEE